MGGLVAPATLGVSLVTAAQAQALTCTGVTAGTSLADCGFEQPNVGTGFAYDPTGTPWSYSGDAGVAGNGSAFTNSQTAPEGTQVGFLQETGSASQTISGWQAGENYTLTMSVAQRLPYNCACGPQNFNVLLDNQLIGTVTASSGTYSDISTAPFSTTPGTHTLTLQGLNTVPGSAGQDNTAFVDALRLTSSPNVPASTSDCKNGGWQTRRASNDATFKNQGDCVSYVASASAASAAPTVYTTTVQSGPGAPGSPDPQVQSSSDGTTWGPAFNDPCCGGSYSTLPGTGWDTVNPSGFASPGDYYFRTSIVLPPNAVNPTLSGQYMADNAGTASVDGTEVVAQSGCDSSNFQQPTSFNSALTAGANTLTFTVNNCPSGVNPVGVDFQATASYTLSPTSTGDCKNGGWQNLTDNNGTPFKNQGDCVSYVATGGKNTAAG